MLVKDIEVGMKVKFTQRYLDGLCACKDPHESFTIDTIAVISSIDYGISDDNKSYALTIKTPESGAWGLGLDCIRPISPRTVIFLS